MCSQRPHSAANIRSVIKQYKNGNNEELHFKNDVRKQEQAKPDSQRNVKSVKQIIAVKPENFLILQGNNKEWKNERVFFTNFPGNTT